MEKFAKENRVFRLFSSERSETCDTPKGIYFSELKNLGGGPGLAVCICLVHIFSLFNIARIRCHYIYTIICHIWWTGNTNTCRFSRRRKEPSQNRGPRGAEPCIKTRFGSVCSGLTLSKQGPSSGQALQHKNGLVWFL